MKKSALILPILFGLLIGACNNSDLHTKASTDSTSGADEKTESPSTSDSKTSNKPAACCFSSIDEVKQFFPAGDAEVKTSGGEPSGDLICQNDPETQSNISCGYTIGNGKLMMRISDYCINPDRVEQDYEKRHTNTLNVYGKDKEIKDISGENYKGFAVYSASGKNGYLQAIVDGRFIITIAGTNQTNFNDIFKLFALVPMSKLAAFKK